jgi:hypothetical protein
VCSSSLFVFNRNWSYRRRRQKRHSFTCDSDSASRLANGVPMKEIREPQDVRRNCNAVRPCVMLQTLIILFLPVNADIKHSSWAALNNAVQPLLVLARINRIMMTKFHYTARLALLPWEVSAVALYFSFVFSPRKTNNNRNERKQSQQQLPIKESTLISSYTQPCVVVAIYHLSHSFAAIVEVLKDRTVPSILNVSIEKRATTKNFC